MIARRIEFRLAALAGIAVALAVAPVLAATRHPVLARKAYQHAVDLQRKLEAKPARQRKAAEYTRVIHEYRNVYYYDFAYTNAPVAAEAMGDLYAEMGRRFKNPRYFHLAIKYYRYVMSQYPGSSMARNAALAVGMVYLEDLNDPSEAADAYQAFLKENPRSAQSSEARKRLKEIADDEAAPKEKASASASKANGPATTSLASNASTNPDGSETSHHDAGRPVQVTGIHDWVGPNYTRVVIEAHGPFQYKTLRLAHPDRIVFDLQNTYVSRALMKQEVRVDGAFLRDIRVGQFKPDVTRIVLDVKNIHNYSTFPLPNPYRLIIDVHGLPHETAKDLPERMKPDPHAAAETGHTEQASAKERTPFVRQAPAARTTPRVETAESPAETTQPKAATAIAYEDQQAVVAKIEAETRHQVQKTAKPKAKAAPEHHAPPAAEPKPVASERHAPAAAEPKPVASEHHAPAAAQPKAEVASKHQTQKAMTGTAEVASAHPVHHVAKRKIEVASTENARNELPLSTKPASPTEDGSQTLTRALGLKVARIVIDPGHGGFDTGTIGPTGLEEKNIVLDIGLRLRKLIETQTDSQVFMTRSTDKFIPLEERTAIANEDRADLFISIHANASRDHHVRGIETYFLNFTSDPEALRLAARENATSQESVHQLQNLIKKIALNNKIEESQELAHDIQTVLYKRMSHVSRGIHNRGVRKAPFVVLIGANMPSVLAEISFLSNPHSEHLLREPSYREQIAKALFRGIEDYINNLGSVRVAQRRQ